MGVQCSSCVPERLTSHKALVVEPKNGPKTSKDKMSAKPELIVITLTEEMDLPTMEESPNFSGTIVSARKFKFLKKIPTNELDQETKGNPPESTGTRGLLKVSNKISEEDEDVEDKELVKARTSDPDMAIHSHETIDKTSKKVVSFFQLASLESNQGVHPIEFMSSAHGTAWRLQNIKLNSLIYKSPGRYLWEASNQLTHKKCALKITLIESSKLVNNNFSRTEALLKELTSLKNQNVIDVYGFSIFESEFHNKSYLVVATIQEIVRCSLRDVHRLKVEQGSKWTEDQVLRIIYEIYSGLYYCKNNNITHGKLSLENILVSENMEKLLIADFDLRLPLSGTTILDSRTYTMRGSTKKITSLAMISEESTRHSSTPHEKDIQNLVVVAMKLITQNENLGFSFDTLKNDQQYKIPYQKVFEFLESILGRKKPSQEILNSLEKSIRKENSFADIDFASETNRSSAREDPIEILFTKIDCYEILKDRESAVLIYTELMNTIRAKEQKGAKEYFQYMRCMNKTIKHYVAMNDWLKAKDFCNDLNKALKKEEQLRSIMRKNPQEYINFLYLLGNIWEGLGETEQAIAVYIKGYLCCNQKNLGHEGTPMLRKIADLSLLKKDYIQARLYLGKLTNFYIDIEDEGHFDEKAEAYEKMGNIACLQGDEAQAVKMYAKCLENLKQGKQENNNQHMLEIVTKIIESCIKLKEDDNILKYKLEALDLRKKLYGADNEEWLNDMQIVGNLYFKKGKYENALNYYLKYHEGLSRMDKIKKEEYVQSYMYLADTYDKLGQYEKAVSYYEKFAEFRRQIEGTKDRQYLSALDKKANILFKSEKFERALEIQLWALETQKISLINEDLYIIISTSNIADTYYALKEYDKALEYHLECLKKLEEDKSRFLEEYQKILWKVAIDYDKIGKSGPALDCVYRSFLITPKKGFESDMEKTIEMYDILNRLKETKVTSLDFSRLNIDLERKNEFI